jgi:hypothetical protein
MSRRGKAASASLDRTETILRRLALQNTLREQRHRTPRWQVRGTVTVEIAAVHAAEAKRIAWESYGLRVRSLPVLASDER